MSDTRVRARWVPGSFTKNYGWGPEGSGLVRMYESIRTGFAMKFEPTKRSDYQRRVGGRWHVPLNFFLLNAVIDGESYVVPDELVFQALRHDYSRDFDLLAIFALNLSLAGRWRGGTADQKWPALWAHYYIVRLVATARRWNTESISANDIESFLQSNANWSTDGTRKVSTNLNYIYRVGGISAFESARVERWWVNCLFLALDRCYTAPLPEAPPFTAQNYQDILDSVNFRELSGRWSLEKQTVANHLLVLYAACGEMRRFDRQNFSISSQLTVSDAAWLVATTPAAAFHRTNIRSWKTIPTACANLAKQAGFETILAEDLESFDSEQFIRSRAKAALQKIEEYQIRADLTAEELETLTRD